MDAATLVITTIDGGPTAWAKMFRAVGGHCVEDLVQFLNLADDLEAGVEREEFEVARLRLERAGFRLHDANTSWNNFTQQRMEYAGRVNALARHFATPPAHCIGDRSPLKQPRAHAAAPPADTTRPMSVSRRG